jgi:large subunit ribosomal protein L28
MANICFICGKKAVFGSSQKHRRGVAGKRWKNRVTPTPRLFKPNLQVTTLQVEGKSVRTKICTRCMKRIKKNKEASFAAYS